MAKNSAVNLDITNNADGFDLSGGTTKRKLTTTGADITLTGSGTNTQTMPSSSQTLVGRTSTDTLTNKTLTSPVVNTPTGIVTNDVTESTNQNYVTDSESTVLGNTSGTNTGDDPGYEPGGTDVAVLDGGTGSSTSAGARTNLDVDQSGTDNSTNVSLAGTPNYITIAGQVITRSQIDLTTDVTGNLPTSNVADLSGTNTGDQTITQTSKSITVEAPTDAEDISMFFTSEAMTITKIAAVLVGSATPSVTWTIRHSTDRSATGNQVVTGGTTTTSITTGSIVTSFNDATVPANSFVWLETTAQSGTVDSLNLNIIYDKD